MVRSGCFESNSQNITPMHFSAGVAALAAQIAALTTQVAALGAQVAALAGLPAQVAALAAQNIKMLNSSALINVHSLHPLPDAAGVLPTAAAPPVWFPVTLGALIGMSAGRGEPEWCEGDPVATSTPSCWTHPALPAPGLALCDFYGLAPHPTNVNTRRAAVAAHIGVRLLQ